MLAQIFRAVDGAILLLLMLTVAEVWTTPPPKLLVAIMVGWTAQRVDLALRHAEQRGGVGQ